MDFPEELKQRIAYNKKEYIIYVLNAVLFFIFNLAANIFFLYLIVFRKDYILILFIIKTWMMFGKKVNMCKELKKEHHEDIRFNSFKYIYTHRFHNLSYKPDGSCGLNYIYQINAIYKPLMIKSGTDYIVATHNNRHFETCNINVGYEDRNVYRNSNGRLVEEVLYNSTFNGNVFILPLNKQIEEHIILCTKQMNNVKCLSNAGRFGKNYEIDDYIYTESEAFDDAFDVNSKDQIYARTIITPLFMEYLLTLKDRYKTFCMVFNNNTVTLLFPDRKIYTTPANARYEKNFCTIDNEARELITLVDELIAQGF